jgi:hypothetical protein
LTTQKQKIDWKLLIIFACFTIFVLIFVLEFYRDGLITKMSKDFATFNASMSLGLGALLIASPTLIKGSKPKELRVRISRLTYEIALFILVNIILFLSSYTQRAFDDIFFFALIIIVLDILIFEILSFFKSMQDIV